MVKVTIFFLIFLFSSCVYVHVCGIPVSLITVENEILLRSWIFLISRSNVRLMFISYSLNNYGECFKEKEEHLASLCLVVHYSINEVLFLPGITQMFVYAVTCSYILNLNDPLSGLSFSICS